MAGNPEGPGLSDVTIYRAGDLYLVRRGDLGRLVGPDGRPRPATPIGSLLAHVHVDDPWEIVGADVTPPAVARVAADEGGWDRPDWARRVD